MDYVFYVTDCETTGLDVVRHDIIEFSILRLNDNQQRTWWLKPTNLDTIDPGALRVNGHKLEDLRHETKAGRDKYKDSSKIIIEIENFIGEDNTSAENRMLIGHNVSFDKERYVQLWNKCNSSDTFPFGRRLIDTMNNEIFMDFCIGKMADNYSLNGVTKKYGIKNEKAHSAEADVKAAREVFDKQVEFFKKALGKL